MEMSKKTKRQAAKKPTVTSLSHQKLPLVAHLRELRKRITYVAISVVLGAVIAYALERKLLDVLLRPSHGQDFIYTSPLGGINFLFSVCLYVGLIVSTPVIMYQLLAFLQPLMQQTTRKFLVLSSLAAGTVAIGGVLFGYFIGLPSALHFLLHQFVTVQVRPLITIQSYMSFVGLYLFGSALMFQLPLILFFINRIKPLKPSGLIKYERHVIIFAFVAAFIMNPTPNVIDQMLIVVPMILMYQLGIALIWYVNRRTRHGKYYHLFEQDRTLQAKRLEQAHQAEPLFSISNPFSLPQASHRPTPQPVPVTDTLDEEPTWADYRGDSTTMTPRRSFAADYAPRISYQRPDSRFLQ